MSDNEIRSEVRDIQKTAKELDSALWSLSEAMEEEGLEAHKDFEAIRSLAAQASFIFEELVKLTSRVPA